MQPEYAGCSYADGFQLHAADVAGTREAYAIRNAAAAKDFGRRDETNCGRILDLMM
jgi:hypothetical protein